MSLKMAAAVVMIELAEHALAMASIDSDPYLLRDASRYARDAARELGLMIQVPCGAAGLRDVKSLIREVRTSLCPASPAREVIHVGAVRAR